MGKDILTFSNTEIEKKMFLLPKKIKYKFYWCEFSSKGRRFLKKYLTRFLLAKKYFIGYLYNYHNVNEAITFNAS